MQRSKSSVLGIFVALVATSLTLLAQKRSVLDIDPPVRGIHWARGHQPAQAGGNPDPGLARRKYYGDRPDCWRQWSKR